MKLTTRKSSLKSLMSTTFSASPGTPLAELLKPHTKAKLVAGLLMLAKTDARVAELLRMQFAQQDDGFDVEHLIAKMRSYVDAEVYRKRSKYGSRYGAADYVFDALDSYLTHLKSFLNSGKQREVFLLAVAIADIAVPLYEQGTHDDFNIEHLIASSVEALNSLIKQPLKPALRAEMLEYFCLEITEQHHIDWDWFYEMMRLACDLVESESDLFFVTRAIDSVASLRSNAKVVALKLQLHQRLGVKE